MQIESAKDLGICGLANEFLRDIEQKATKE